MKNKIENKIQFGWWFAIKQTIKVSNNGNSC